MTSKKLTTYALNRKFIKHWLIDNDATQVELADAVGVSPVTLNRYINDRRGVPVSVLFSIAEEMQADVRDNAEALREWMARTHTTQKELAKMVGVTGCMPSQWLHGAKDPRMSTMLNLADATGMSVYDLMEVDDA